MPVYKPTPEEIKEILKKHRAWLHGDPGAVRADLSYANLSYANLSSANLSSANLSSADLRSADLRYADLSYAYLSSADLRIADLSSADLRYANLRYANLRYANLRSADLRSADLRYADLSSADLSSADLSSANLPPPTVVLLAAWQELPDDLTAALMRLDASCHPLGPEPFEQWAKHNGPCPYEGVRIQRAANFQERKECWGLKTEPLTIYQIMDRILKLKCKGWEGAL
jgi:hypothetical protein